MRLFAPRLLTQTQADQGCDFDFLQAEPATAELASTDAARGSI
jgi:hypothetical protein